MNPMTNSTAPANKHQVDLQSIQWGAPFAMIGEHAVAEILGLSVRSLRAWRLAGRGPKFIKVNSCAVRYRIGDLQNFIAAQPAGGGAA